MYVKSYLCGCMSKVYLYVFMYSTGMSCAGAEWKADIRVGPGQRRGIPNFDTFLALNFSMADVTVISDVKLSSSIPVKISFFLHTNIHTYIHTYIHALILS
jgi:hypothetical protein